MENYWALCKEQYNWPGSDTKTPCYNVLYEYVYNKKNYHRELRVIEYIRSSYLEEQNLAQIEGPT